MLSVKQHLLVLVLLMVIPVAALAKDPLGISAMDGGFEYVTSVEGIHEYRLPNGLQVLLFPNPAQARRRQRYNCECYLSCWFDA